MKNMLSAEQKNMMGLAAQEIRSLRQQNSHMATRLQMFDDMMLLLRTEPRGGQMQGRAEDVAWLLEQELKRQEGGTVVSPDI